MSGKLDMDESGNIKVSPLVGYDIHLAAGMFAIARLRYAPTPEALKTASLDHLQLTLTPVQCRELAESLLQAASRLQNHTTPKRPA